MSAQLKANETATAPPVVEDVQVDRNGSKHNQMAPPRRETPPLRQDDSLLHDTLAFMMQQAADNSKVTNALLEKMANGNGAGKAKSIIQATYSIIAAVFIVGGLILAIGSDRSTQQARIQRLEEKVTEAERVKDKLEKLEKLYMVRFGTDPEDDIKKQETIRRK